MTGPAGTRSAAEIGADMAASTAAAQVWMPDASVALHQFERHGVPFTADDVWAAIGARSFQVHGPVWATDGFGLVPRWAEDEDDPERVTRPIGELGSTSAMGACLPRCIRGLEFVGFVRSRRKGPHARITRLWRPTTTTLEDAA